MNLANTERPRRFSEVLWQDTAKAALKRQGATGKYAQVHGFYGKLGCGKTTFARILAKAINCENRTPDGEPCCNCDSCRSIESGNAPDIIEIDAASHNGVADARDLIEQSIYRPTFLQKKIYIIDEVHMLSTAAFNALLKTLEEPPEWCTFILCTTEREKIPATVLSRIVPYQITEVPTAVMQPRIIEVARKYGADCSESAAALIARHADGSMRNAIRDLEQCLEQTASISETDAAEILGTTSTEETRKLLTAIATNNKSEIAKINSSNFEKGRTALSVIGEMIKVLSDIILFCIGTKVEGEESYRNMVADLAEMITMDKALALSSALFEVKSRQYLTGREILLVKLLEISSDTRVTTNDTELAGKVACLEDRVQQLEAEVRRPKEKAEAEESPKPKQETPMPAKVAPKRAEAPMEFDDFDIPDLDDLADEADSIGANQGFKPYNEDETPFKASLEDKINDLLADPQKKAAYERCSVTRSRDEYILTPPDEISYLIASDAFKGESIIRIIKGES